MRPAAFPQEIVAARRQECLRKLWVKEYTRQLYEEELLVRNPAFERLRKRLLCNQRRRTERRKRAQQKLIAALPEEIRFTLHIQSLDWWDGPNPQPRSAWSTINRMKPFGAY